MLIVPVIITSLSIQISVLNFNLLVMNQKNVKVTAAAIVSAMIS